MQYTLCRMIPATSPEEEKNLIPEHKSTAITSRGL
jgi:hypothetical protein